MSLWDIISHVKLNKERTFEWNIKEQAMIQGLKLDQSMTMKTTYHKWHQNADHYLKTRGRYEIKQKINPAPKPTR